METLPRSAARGLPALLTAARVLACALMRSCPHRVARCALCVSVAWHLGGCGPVTMAVPPAPRDAVDPEPVGGSGYFFGNRGYGTDVYAGPFDVLLNKGFAVAQWRHNNRAIFRHDYAWRTVAASLTNPGAAVARAGGWKKVLLRHAVPFYSGGLGSDPQWVPNYFGHVLEGGMAYRRLAEWNRANGVPFPTITAATVTYVASIVNEAYETEPPPPGAPVLGSPSVTMDLLIFDPLGILLFSTDAAARIAARFDAALWPSQGSLVLPSGTLQNNGESIVFKVPLPATRHRLFLRGGIGVEGGISYRYAEGLDVSVAVGMQSFRCRVDPETYIERADFSWAGGAWLDREGTLLAGLTVDTDTDRRVALNLYPGLLRAAGVGFGAWLLVDAEGRLYVGFTGHTLGLGAGIGF